MPAAGEDGVFLEIKPLPKSVPEGDIDLCGETSRSSSASTAWQRLAASA